MADGNENMINSNKLSPDLQKVWMQTKNEFIMNFLHKQQKRGIKNCNKMVC